MIGRLLLHDEISELYERRARECQEARGKQLDVPLEDLISSINLISSGVFCQHCDFETSHSISSQSVSKFVCFSLQCLSECADLFSTRGKQFLSHNSYLNILSYISHTQTLNRRLMSDLPVTCMLNRGCQKQCSVFGIFADSVGRKKDMQEQSLPGVELGMLYSMCINHLDNSQCCLHLGYVR